MKIPRIGAAVADAVHNLHQQDAIHLDLKPDNVVIKPDGSIALIDFGLAHHAHHLDLLAEEKRDTAGWAPYVSPEQVCGTQFDPRSDVFALGVVLYEMTTGKLPFGTPQTMAGLRDRLWLDPAPPRTRSEAVPPWLQEIILRCLEPDADARYQSAAHLAFDLRHPDQVELTRRALNIRQAGLLAQARRWWRVRTEDRLHPHSRPKAQTGKSPVIMVAVDTMHPDDTRQPLLLRATAQMLAVAPEFRLICVSVIRAGSEMEQTETPGQRSNIHLEHLVRMQNWAQPLGLPERKISMHVVESFRPESALLDFAHQNHVSLIMLGAPGPGQHAMAWWRSVASGVTARARCSVYVVRVPEAVMTIDSDPDYLDDYSNRSMAMQKAGLD